MIDAELLAADTSPIQLSSLQSIHVSPGVLEVPSSAHLLHICSFLERLNAPTLVSVEIDLTESPRPGGEQAGQPDSEDATHWTDIRRAFQRLRHKDITLHLRLPHRSECSLPTEVIISELCQLEADKVVVFDFSKWRSSIAALLSLAEGHEA